MNVAKRLLNHKEETKGVWQFCFLHDISSSYLLSVGQRMHGCGKNWWLCSSCVCSQATATGCLHHIYSVGKRGQAYPSLWWHICICASFPSPHREGEAQSRQTACAKSLWWTQTDIDLICETVLPFLDCVMCDLLAGDFLLCCLTNLLNSRHWGELWHGTHSRMHGMEIPKACAVTLWTGWTR